ncbi:MAG: thiol:disulfide interchange protein DsbA/DsbL [Candidatus Parabeggiatoa sp. nov. 3]|nr:MAG: thiol:disulfide interchange protein DsbA/DsbL [Gammaproteobacteria bacterium]RKZ62174.1 MAG: thiol:disulfide interchange protein DsbA/DsbL [Gammaproteobacteria bacterium]RKZ81624.1 MAG: thiol:disulfide interchange protein DsbA/DsbL [Gammaproteobacteria bacterium]
MKITPFKKGLILACLTASSFFFAAGSFANADDPYAGLYDTLKNPQPPITQTGKIEVVEFFWYRCGHCYYLEGPLEAWLKEKKPVDVAFIRIPAVWPNYSWAFSAKVFYSAKELGVLDDIHVPYFESIHRKRKPTKREQQLINQVFEFFYTTDFLEPEEVERNRKLLAGKIEDAKELTQNYGVRGVPVIYVNGRYRLSPSKAGSYDKMFEILDYLIKKAR